MIEKSDCLEAMANKEPPMSRNNSPDPKPQSLMPNNPNLFYKKKTDISNPVDARNGVVRILSMDDETNPSSFSTGSGFGVGIIGEETAVFLTNRQRNKRKHRTSQCRKMIQTAKVSDSALCQHFARCWFQQRMFITMQMLILPIIF